MSNVSASGSREVPETIGRYEILKRLAVGGMAEVFLGRIRGEGGFEKLVAVKRVHPDLAREAQFTEMFIDEARITADLNHTNIAQVYDFGRSGDSCYQAMEFVQGVDLTHVLAFFLNQNRVPPPSLVTYIMVHVCSALEYAHAKCDNTGNPLRIIHRDVSPGNVLIGFEGEIKLIDFGVAKATRRTQETAKGILKGKVAFMSPEQVRGKPLDHRSDIFSAGSMMYELITGYHPFRSEDDIVTLELIRAGKAPRPSTRLVVPEELEAIVMKAMEAKLKKRYANAGLMERDLEEFRSANPLSRHKVVAWMKKSFAKELESVRSILSLAASAPPIKKAPTMELVADDVVEGSSPFDMASAKPKPKLTPIETAPTLARDRLPADPAPGPLTPPSTTPPPPTGWREPALPPFAAPAPPPPEPIAEEPTTALPSAPPAEEPAAAPEPDLAARMRVAPPMEPSPLKGPADPLAAALPQPPPPVVDPAIKQVVTEKEETPAAPPEEPVVSMGHMVDDIEKVKVSSGWLKVVFGVLLGLGIAGALSYQIWYTIKRGPKLLPMPKKQPGVVAEDDTADDPSIHTVSVTAETLLGKCRARIGDAVNENQVLPCRFRVQAGKDFKLLVTAGKLKPLRMQWSVKTDRVIDVKRGRWRKIEIVSDSGAKEP